MPKTHPDEKALEKFSRGKLSRRENLKVAWHLFNCAACREQVEGFGGDALLGDLFEGLKPLDIADNPTYDRAFSYGQSSLEVRGEARDRDRARAPKLFTELMRHPVSRQRALIQRTWRFKNYVFGEYLLEQSYQSVFDEPSRAEDLAELALSVAKQLEGSHYGPALINDLKARAWAYVANARRVANDFAGAAEAMTEAKKWLGQGTDDILLKARLLALEGTLRREQRRFDEAHQRFDEALEIYREAGESHWENRTLVSVAHAYHDAGEPDKSIQLLKKVIPALDAEREPRLLFVAKQNLLTNLVEGEQYEEAKKLLPETQRLAQEVGSQLDAVRVRWAAGKVARGLGRLDEAEKTFNAVRDEFVERSLSYDAALSCLDLAALYAEQGRTGEMKKLAEEMLPIFNSRGVHREATAALLVFHQAARAESATVKLVREISSYLQEARKNPELQFKGA